MSDELVMGRFRLIERIGSGGMGTVFRAYDERLQREVALKEVDAEPARVLREAQAAARLNHPGIVTLYELGEHDGRAVLVSELVPGRTLAELRRTGELTDRDLADFLIDLCDALEHAHARGVVHRDIKPANVIVREHGFGTRSAKLMDFGIARLAGAPTLTADGEVVGTLAYMSPEQAEGELAGPESDVYSLALTAYECWSGVNPVAAHSPAATARRIGELIPPLRELRPDLPEGLVDTIDACLDPIPELRPTPPDLRESLEAERLALDTGGPLPAGADDGARRGTGLRLGTARVALMLGAAAVLTLLAGPSGAPGLALVGVVLLLPMILAGATLASLAVALAPVLGSLGIAAAAPALGAAAPGALARAALGAGAWIWIVVASLGFGLGSAFGLAAEAPRGWAADASLAIDGVVAPLLSLESLAGAGCFALSAASLGWVVTRSHLSLALLGAMLWAAGVNAALALVADGSLGSQPAVVVAAAAAAVGLEFRSRRASAVREQPLEPVRHRRGLRAPPHPASGV